MSEGNLKLTFCLILANSECNVFRVQIAGNSFCSAMSFDENKLTKTF